MTCQFKRDTGEFCKRNVAPGESKCWQHEYSWGRKWKSLTGNQTITFFLVIAGVLLGVPGAYLAYDSWRNHQPPIQRTAKFAVMIPFDTAPNSSPIPLDENPDDQLFRTYADMVSLAMNGTVPEIASDAKADGQIQYQAKSVSMQEAPSFLGRLLQYYVFHSIDDLQRNSLTVAVGYPAEANPGIEPPDAESYPYERLSSELAGNLFFKPFLHRPSGDEMAWKLKSVRMPKGTEIKFLQMSDPDKYIVRIQRPFHFKVDFVIESLAGTGTGQVPKNFVTPRASTTMEWTYFVTMHYTIEHPKDNDFNPSLYSQWLDALYDGLHRRLVIESPASAEQKHLTPQAGPKPTARDQRVATLRTLGKLLADGQKKEQECVANSPSSEAPPQLYTWTRQWEREIEIELTAIDPRYAKQFQGTEMLLPGPSDKTYYGRCQEIRMKELILNVTIKHVVAAGSD